LVFVIKSYTCLTTCITRKLEKRNCVVQEQQSKYNHTSNMIDSIGSYRDKRSQTMFITYIFN